jgi:hypothetical protein
MGRAIVAALGLAAFTFPGCTTDACACTPAIVPALVTGRVVDDRGTPASGAQVRAFSAPAAGCHSLDTDFGSVAAENDGEFRMGLPSGLLQDSVCVLVFARPRGRPAALGDSDTTLLVMDFRDELTLDSARVELVLRAR